MVCWLVVRFIQKYNKFYSIKQATWQVQKELLHFCADLYKTTFGYIFPLVLLFCSKIVLKLTPSIEQPIHRPVGIEAWKGLQILFQPECGQRASVPYDPLVEVPDLILASHNPAL